MVEGIADLSVTWTRRPPCLIREATPGRLGFKWSVSSIAHGSDIERSEHALQRRVPAPVSFSYAVRRCASIAPSPAHRSERDRVFTGAARFRVLRLTITERARRPCRCDGSGLRFAFFLVEASLAAR